MEANNGVTVEVERQEYLTESEVSDMLMRVGRAASLHSHQSLIATTSE